MTADPARTVASIIAAAAVLALPVAACGGGGSPGTAGSGSQSALAYSDCMRSHGVPNFPDPESNGGLPKADAHRLGVSSSQLQAAEQACRHELPIQSRAIDAGSITQCMMADDCPRALVRHVMDEERRFAGCMRSHGVPNWPDPSIDSQGRPVFALRISKLGFDPYSPQIWAQGNGCSHLMPDLPGAPFAVSP